MKNALSNASPSWFSIRTRVDLAFLWVLIPLLITGFLSYRATLALQASQRKVVHSMETMQGIEETQTLLNGAESAARGFAISGNEKYTGSISRSATQSQQRVHALQSANIGDSEYQDGLAQVEPLISQRLDLLKETVRARREQGAEAAFALLLTDRGRTLMGEIELQLVALEQREAVLLARQREEADARELAAFQTIIGATAASLLLVVFMGYVLARKITLPLLQLSRGAQAIAGGTTSHRVVIRRADEIGTLAAAFNTMAGEIERREAELNLANVTLVQQNREVQRATLLKSQFLAGMSHELRTPLNAILGFSELLADETPGPLNAGQKRFVTHVRTASKHLLQLINDILDLSKIEAGHIEFQIETFTVSSALAEVLSITRPLSMMKNLTLLNQVDPEHAIICDRIRIKQVL